MFTVLFLCIFTLSVGSIGAVGECPSTPPSRILTTPKAPPVLPRAGQKRARNCQVQENAVDPLANALIASSSAKKRLFPQERIPVTRCRDVFGSCKPGHDGDEPNGQHPLSV